MPDKKHSDPMEALKKAKTIDNPGGSSWPLPPNGGLGRATRAAQAEKSGSPSASGRIFPADFSKGVLDTGAGMHDYELSADDRPKLKKRTLPK